MTWRCPNANAPATPGALKPSVCAPANRAEIADNARSDFNIVFCGYRFNPEVSFRSAPTPSASTTTTRRPLWTPTF
jgi:hypothetical protein